MRELHLRKQGRGDTRAGRVGLETAQAWSLRLRECCGWRRQLLSGATGLAFRGSPPVSDGARGLARATHGSKGCSLARTTWHSWHRKPSAPHTCAHTRVVAAGMRALGWVCGIPQGGQSPPEKLWHLAVVEVTTL